MKNNKLLTVSRKIFQMFINLLLIVVGLLLVLAIYNIVNIKVLKKDYTSYFGYTAFSITSGSMEKTIYKDDYVIVKINNKNIKKGDIITYRKDDTTITHRIVKIEKNTITTRGDNNNVDDEPINRKDIIGKVVHIGHEYGIYLKVIKTPQVFITFFIALLFMDMALSGDKEVREVANKTKE